MKITTISLTKTIAMPGYNNDKPAVVEAILEEGDTMEECLSELNKRLTAWHRAEYPHLSQSNSLLTGIRQETPTIQQVQDREQAKKDIKSSIEGCSNMDELKNFKLLASTSAELTTAYMNKLKELTNAER